MKALIGLAAILLLAALYFWFLVWDPFGWQLEAVPLAAIFGGLGSAITMVLIAITIWQQGAHMERSLLQVEAASRERRKEELKRLNRARPRLTFRTARLQSLVQDEQNLPEEFRLDLINEGPDAHFLRFKGPVKTLPSRVIKSGTKDLISLDTADFEIHEEPYLMAALPQPLILVYESVEGDMWIERKKIQARWVASRWVPEVYDLGRPKLVTDKDDG